MTPSPLKRVLLLTQDHIRPLRPTGKGPSMHGSVCNNVSFPIETLHRLSVYSGSALGNKMTWKARVEVYLSTQLSILVPGTAVATGSVTGRALVSCRGASFDMEGNNTPFPGVGESPQL